MCELLIVRLSVDNLWFVQWSVWSVVRSRADNKWLKPYGIATSLSETQTLQILLSNRALHSARPRLFLPYRRALHSARPRFFLPYRESSTFNLSTSFQYLQLSQQHSSLDTVESLKTIIVFI